MNGQKLPLKLQVQICLHSLQCWGSVTFLYGSGCGSGSSDPYLCLTDPDVDPGGPDSEYWYIYIILHRSYKTVEIKVFITIFLDDGRIRSRIRTCD